MPNRASLLRRLFRFLYRENLHRVMLVIAALSVASAVALRYLEPERPLVDWLWWSVVTITTVGYGDLTPSQTPGRLIGILLMFSGIGVLSMFTATVASFFVELQVRKDRGLNALSFDNHFILCEWNSRAQAIYEELRSDSRTVDRTIVLLDDNIEKKPVDDDDLHFIRGDASEESLRRAGVMTASTVIILGDDSLDPASRDAKVVLTTLTTEHLNPDAYTVVELVREENARHCERAHADEIIVGDEFSSRLIASAAVDHGISKVMSELLSTRFGSDLKKVPLPDAMAGKAFLDVLGDMKRSNSSTTLAVVRDEHVFTNPEPDFLTEAGDFLIVITGRLDR